MDFVIWIVIVWFCAMIFWGLGVFAGKMKGPMWFWSGSAVRAEDITDVNAYNRENARMWKLYSLPYWISGLVFYWWRPAAVLLVVFAATIGLFWLVRTYLKIEKKYRK